MRFARFALLGAAVAAPAAALPIQFSALLRGEIGYGTNPFVRPGVTEGSGHGELSFSPKFFYQDARSTTSLNADLSRDQYFTRFGNTESARVELTRLDQITAHLSATTSAYYATTNKATLSNPDAIDNEPLNLGRRTYKSGGAYQLQWQASARDQITYGTTVSHLSYGGGGSVTNLAASSYTSYAMTGGYNRTIDARTTVGAQVSLSEVNSKLYPASRTLQPGLTVRRQLSAIWTVDAHAGVVLQHIDGPLTSDSTSLSYGLNICATYPRTHLCVSAQHQTSPSGYGALRKNDSITASLTHDLTEHSHVSLSADFYKTGSTQSTIAPSINAGARALLVTGEYDRDLTTRISAGFGGTYQWRDTGTIGAGRAISGTFHVNAKLGRM